MNAPASTPVAGKDYPATWNAFLDRFATEEACLRYLERLRWPDRFVCPVCALAGEPYRSSRARLVCRGCGHQSTVTAGTIFEKTRTPLRVWLAAAWYVTNQKRGVSALGLQRVLGLGSYETAWTMLHRFRRAMVRAGREPLRGCVEVDETYLAISEREAPVAQGGKKSNTSKILVIVAVEVLEPRGFGRIRLKRIARATQEIVVGFVQEVIEPGAHVRTDGSPAYRPLGESGYEHEPRVVTGSKAPAHALLPGVHRVSALLKRWILGTPHGAVQPAQLDHYLDEFAFRFNRRTSGSRGMLFYRLLEQAVITAPVTYAHVITSRP